MCRFGAFNLTTGWRADDNIATHAGGFGLQLYDPPRPPCRHRLAGDETPKITPNSEDFP